MTTHRFVVERLHRGQWLRLGTAATIEQARGLPDDWHVQYRVLDLERGMTRMLDVSRQGPCWAEGDWRPV